MNNPILKIPMIRALIGLGNPGKSYHHNRHNIGFRVIEELAKQYQAPFKKADHMELAQLTVDNKLFFLIMPQTFMNSSGNVIPFLTKKGIGAENILVVHDELELPFGKLKFKMGGSAKGHNGLKSIIQQIGHDFPRLAIGIGRPENRDDVPDYVLENFNDPVATEHIINQAVKELEISVLKI